MNKYKLISPTGHTEIVEGTNFSERMVWNGNWIAQVPDDWLVIVERP